MAGIVKVNEALVTSIQAGSSTMMLAEEASDSGPEDAGPSSSSTLLGARGKKVFRTEALGHMKRKRPMHGSAASCSTNHCRNISENRDSDASSNSVSLITGKTPLKCTDQEDSENQRFWVPDTDSDSDIESFEVNGGAKSIK